MTLHATFNRPGDNLGVMSSDPGLQEAQRIPWDVIVVGTGPGGAAVGWALTTPKRRILFLERGLDLRDGDALRGQLAEDLHGFRSLSESERRLRLARCGRMVETIEDATRGDRFLPHLGCGTGGSSVLYGMTMERLFPSDFQSGWPLSYQEMVPWYEAAESLFRVRGTPDPIRGEPVPHLLEPLPLSPANQAVFDAARAQDLHPYRLHLACERLPGCTLCHGHLCGASRTCKNDALRICLEPALAQEGNQLLCRTAVTRLESLGRSVTLVHARHEDGTALRLRGRIVVLASGALSTPRILLNSGLANRSGLVGRCLMRHVIDLYVLRKAPPPEEPAVAKELGLNDFYCVDGRKLGSIQSFGLPPSVDYLLNQPGFNVWRWMGPLAGSVARRFAGTPIIASVLEDAPDPDNAVNTPGGGWRIRYRLGSAEIERRRLLRDLVHRTFRRFGPVRGGGTEDRKGLGHVCGTCRLGDDPRSSVLDTCNRAHDLDNLYVTDASFFPASGAVSPALTIVANALRVAAHIGQRL
jgi:choline dehydrogenase-like flavoprotein